MHKKKHAISKNFLSVMIFVIICISVTAQDLPKIIHPSPEVSALFKFQDYPMDYSTGLPQISIPIYDVKSGSLSVPISISYHASGRKVYDRDGPIALGWSLDAGGTISRTVYGAVDFGTATNGTYKFPYPFVTGNLTNTNNLAYFQSIIHSEAWDCDFLPWMDSEYDMFSYSFGKQSGKFFFKDANDVKTPVLLPYKPLVVTPYYSTGTTSMTGLGDIEIVDESGTLYRFEAMERFLTSNENATTGWVLTEIISADKTDNITFTYAARNDVRTTISQQITLIDNWQMLGELFPIDHLIQDEVTSEEEYSIARLTEITFKQGKVVFNLVSGSDKISNIQILNKSNEVIKTIQFNRSQCYSQSEIEYATHKLDAILFKDKSDATAETYSFEYYPLVSSNGQVNVRHCDWWGYYNNSTIGDFVPYYTNVNFLGSGGGGESGNITVGNPSANRNPALEPKKSGVLKKITYPTGGSTEFVYENNMCTLFGGVGTPIAGPGLRIYQIKSYEHNSALPIIKTYKYGVNEIGYGAIDILPDMTTMATESQIGYLNGPTSWWTPQRSGKYRQRIFYSGFIKELSDISERPVTYTEVAEYYGTETSNIGKTIYKYDYTPWSVSAMSPLISLAIPKKHVSNFNYWNNTSLLSKAEYKRINAGPTSTYEKVKEVTNVYATTVTETVTALHVQRITSIPQSGYGTAIPPGETTPRAVCSELFAISESSNNPLGVPAPLYTSDAYQIPVGYKNLTATSEMMYNTVGAPIESVTSYVYNSKQLPASISRITSDGSTITTEIKYPFDFSGNATLTGMVNLNMLNFHVEQIEKKNSTIHLKSVKTNYYDWGSSNPMFAPQTVEVKTGTNSYETRLRIHSYDEDGNVTSVSKERDVPKIYIWGYNNCYPVAEVTGISYANVISILDQNIIQNPPSDQALRDELNKIRQRFPSALVSTYTLKPLIGMTSQTDQGGKTVYFEYDDYNRLKLMKDLNGNIIKTYKYQLQGVSAN